MHCSLSTRFLGVLALSSVASAQCFEQQLNASDPTDVGVFSWSMDLDIDRLAVGAIGTDDACVANPGCNSGSAYVFHRSAGVWSEVSRLTASDGALGDQFGHDVALSGDRLLVGAHLKQGGGAAYMFAYNGTDWVQEQKLLGSGQMDAFHFGHSVALDGELAVVGTMRDDHQGFETGAAYVFERVAGTWVEQQKLVASDAATGDRYGRSSDVEGDFIAIGGHLHDGVGTDSGAAYLYERDDNGTPLDPLDDSWPEVAALTASDAHADMFFGRSVDLSGNLLVVGASKAINGGVASGAAYIYFRTANGWNEVQRISASNGAAGDRFGISVSIDGIYLLVGARAAGAYAQDSGDVYVFTRTPAGYIETARLGGPDTGIGDQLGNETGVHVNGTTVLIGSRFNSAVATTGGSAYTFTLADCLGESYCDVVPNSAGPGAQIRAAGIESVSDGTFTLISSGAIPNKIGLFFYGSNQINVPLGNGRLCIGGAVRLNPPLVSDSNGTATLTLDFNTAPVGAGPNQINIGSTWSFQHWFRDTAAGGSLFTLSDGVQVTFIP